MASNLIPQHYTLNGEQRNIHEFSAFVTQKLRQSNLATWEREIFLFYSEWLNTEDTITVQSSGSTGPPKQIKFKKWQLFESALQTGRYFRFNELGNLLLCLPARYIAGKLMIVRALVYGLNLIIQEPGSDPFAHLETKVDFAAVTPHQLHQAITNGSPVSKAKTLIIGGGQISTDLLTIIQELSTACYATYGMTETLTHIALQRLNGQGKSDLFTCLPGIKIRTDNRKCLVITVPFIKDEIVTNDVIERISNIQFRWLGRADNVINSGGVKIFPEQVEAQLAKLIDENFYISSIPDNALGQKLILYIEGRTPLFKEKTQLMEQMKQLLPSHHCPKEIKYIHQFEYTRTGKIIRNNFL